MVHMFLQVNAATINFNYPMHRMEPILHMVSPPGWKVFFKADATNGYWAVPLAREHAYKNNTSWSQFVMLRDTSSQSCGERKTWRNDEYDHRRHYSILGIALDVLHLWPWRETSTIIGIASATVAPRPNSRGLGLRRTKAKEMALLLYFRVLPRIKAHIFTLSFAST